MLRAKQPETVTPRKPKILISGASGVGKTWGSLDFPAVYYIDTEDGADLAHYQKKLAAAGGAYLGSRDGSLDPAVVLDQFRSLAEEKHPYKTVVIDSLTKLFMTIQTREAERLGDKDAFGASKKPAVKFMKSLIGWANRIDMNVIFICHSKEVWEGSGNDRHVAADRTFDGWDKLEYELHLWLEVQKRGPERIARIRKSRLEQFPMNEVFPWGFAEFAKRYGEEIIQRETTQLVLATPEQVTEVTGLVTQRSMDDKWVEKCWTKAGVNDWSEMDRLSIEKVIAYLKKEEA